MTIFEILDEVEAELQRASRQFGAFGSRHEGCAVIREEFEELWELVKGKDTRLDQERAEAVQIAAMAVRYIWDLCTFPRDKEFRGPRPEGLTGVCRAK